MFHGLAWQGVHEIQIEGCKGPGRLFHGGQCLGAVMHPPDRHQVGIIKTLNSHRQTRDTGLSERTKPVFFESAGVGFHGDLAFGLKFQSRANVPQQAIHRGGIKHAGCSATQKDAVHGTAPDER